MLAEIDLEGCEAASSMSVVVLRQSILDFNGADAKFPENVSSFVGDAGLNPLALCIESICGGSPT